METKLIYDERIKYGLTYRKYVELTEKYIDQTDVKNLNEEELEKYNYTKLNLQRSKRIEKTFNPSNEIVEIIKNICTPQTWMVITENWCGDSAQNLPYISKLSELNKNINLVIVLRDSNLDIMNKYLTNGTMSIPILIVFDENGDELFKWGPRPDKAKEEIKRLKKEEIVKPELYEKLHLWYGRNRGEELLKELSELLESAVSNQDIVKVTYI